MISCAPRHSAGCCSAQGQSHVLQGASQRAPTLPGHPQASWRAPATHTSTASGCLNAQVQGLTTVCITPVARSARCNGKGVHSPSASAGVLASTCMPAVPAHAGSAKRNGVLPKLNCTHCKACREAGCQALARRLGGPQWQCQHGQWQCQQGHMRRRPWCTSYAGLAQEPVLGLHDECTSISAACGLPTMHRKAMTREAVQRVN